MKKIFLLAALPLLLAFAACAGRDDGKYTTIAISNASTFLTEAVTLFNEMNPDTPVRLNVFSARNVTDEAARIERFVNYISTAFMGGHADDIIVLNNLPFLNYFDMLTDLAPLIAESDIIQEDDFFINLFDALKSDGRQFVIPLDFNISVIAFHDEFVHYFDISDGISLMEVNTIGLSILNEVGAGRNIGLHRFDAFPMFFNTVHSDFNRYIDIVGRQSRINDDSFVAMLEMYRYLEQRRFIPSMEDFMEGFVFDETVVHLTDITDIRVLVQEYEPFVSPTAVSGTDGEVHFTSHIILGMNNMSQNKETAWAFIEFLLSETMQKSLTLPALPVNRQAFRDSSFLMIENYLQMLMDGGMPMVGSAEDFANMYIVKVEEITDMVSHFRYFEPIITNILLDVGWDFFFGTQTARYTADVMHNRVSLYLSE